MTIFIHSYVLVLIYAHKYILIALGRSLLALTVCSRQATM